MNIIIDSIHLEIKSMKNLCHNSHAKIKMTESNIHDEFWHKMLIKASISFRDPFL